MTTVRITYRGGQTTKLQVKSAVPPGPNFPYWTFYYLFGGTQKVKFMLMYDVVQVEMEEQGVDIIEKP